MRLRTATVTAVVGLLVLGGTDTAFADSTSGCSKIDPETMTCQVPITPPATPGNPGHPATGNTGDSGAACWWDPAAQGLSGPPAGPVPCTSGAGYWSNGYHCYIRRAEPQPPASDPAWRGHEPGDGAVYWCFQPQTDMDVMVWAQNPPDGPASGPTPAEVAQGAVAKLGMKAIDVGITPPPVEVKPSSMGIIGIPTYLWAANPTPTTVGPITDSASAGTITVTLTAKLERVEWSMGDGTTVTCEGANAKGTPYEPGYGKSPSSTCGHTYQKTSWNQPNHQYTVTARSYWRVDWAGAGQSGTIRPDPLQRTVHLNMAEAQVLVH